MVVSDAPTLAWAAGRGCFRPVIRRTGPAGSPAAVTEELRGRIATEGWGCAF
jgi:hypothetical protein